MNDPDMSLQINEVTPGSFIYEISAALDPIFCESLIERFENNPQQQNQGRIGENADTELSMKHSTDLRISGRADWKDADAVLQQSLTTALGMLSTLHPFFRSNPLRDIGYNLQRTLPGEYYHWHVDGGPGEFAKRQLVALWYLNHEGIEGGTTDFFHQQTSLNPEQGKLVLFPPFWTHVHRGAVVAAGRKYIATTWVCTR